MFLTLSKIDFVEAIYIYDYQIFNKFIKILVLKPQTNMSSKNDHLVLEKVFWLKPARGERKQILLKINWTLNTNSNILICSDINIRLKR